MNFDNTTLAIILAFVVVMTILFLNRRAIFRMTKDSVEVDTNGETKTPPAGKTNKMKNRGDKAALLQDSGNTGGNNGSNEMDNEGKDASLEQDTNNKNV
jgi:hypothetical protein